MSQQAVDLRGSGQVVRRHKIIICAVTVLGLLAGAAYTVLRPPTLTSTALVVLPQAAQSTLPPGATGPDSYMATQIWIASSDPVLSRAVARLSPAPSVQALRSEVQVKSLTPDILSISAQGTSAGQAEARANAVAASYVAYITSAHSGFVTSARVLNQATSASGSAAVRGLIYALLGALLGALIGVLAAFAINRADRRLYRRDEIAAAVGMPVLASVPVRHPADAAGWARLLEDYRPGDLYGWRLRHALQQLGMDGTNAHDAGSSLAVVSLSSDPRALAFGPQLAAYAATLGIPTALVLGPHETTTATATLRTACDAALPGSARRSSHLITAVSDRGDLDRRLNAVLTVIGVVVDGQAPQMGGMVSTTATVIAVSAGAATAEQLARVAMCVADDGREIAGIFVADPEPTDRTTGRIPQPPRSARPQQAQYQASTRLKDSTVTEIRR